MITVKPFKALRPAANAQDTAALPYDVMSSDEARLMAQGKPNSFLHIDKPEIDLPPGTNLYDDAVYAKAKENFDRMVNTGVFIQEQTPCFYIYSQTMDGRTQYGYALAASTAEYGAGAIKKHEFTRKDKEADRTRHVNTLNAATGPVFLAYKNSAELDALLKTNTQGAPLYDFVSEDGIRHTLWRISDGENIEKIRAAFSKLDALYIADGHHRCASAYNVSLERRAANPAHTGAEDYNFFLSVVFPAEQLYIMDYNRAVKDLNGLSRSDFLAKIKEHFDVEETSLQKPSSRHHFGMYLAGQWYSLKAKAEVINEGDPIKSLDVSILQDNVLGPVLGINDPRTDTRIDFIGGVRGAAELERYVDNLGYAAAFTLYPTSMGELMRVADAGLVMPPKSTWFEPKLRSGLLIYKY